MGDHPKPVDTNNPKQIEKTLKILGGTRLEQRRRLAETWLLEEENSRYRYYVETCEDGKRIYLLRPSWLNKGFDFQINLEGFRSKSNEAPKHDDIIGDLAKKKKESPRNFRKLRGLIDFVYECEEPDEVLETHEIHSYSSGLPVDSLLKILKWMFIEQDLTYWNNSGRRMLMGKIRELD